MPPWQKRAYPRSHGATCPLRAVAQQGRGLSPLARGNQPPAFCRAGRAGPIPARTGQPRRPWRRPAASRAYPRSHGATSSVPLSPVVVAGLSPLARGNLCNTLPEVIREGPIPARTGQPYRRGQAVQDQWAYPRSHGATTLLVCLCSVVAGLSPLARGNRGHLWRLLGRGGPIPARTGQPAGARLLIALWWAYPRSHGATASAGGSAIQEPGLSPLARGNRG